MNHRLKPDADLHDEPRDLHVVERGDAEQPRHVVVEASTAGASPKVRNDAGTVGTTDCRNRKSIRTSGCEARHLGQRAQQRHPHDQRRHEDQRVDRRSARSACCSAAFTTTGVCVTMTTRLKTIVAGMSRDR